MKDKTALLSLNGTPVSRELVEKLNRLSGLVAGADGGYLPLVKMGFRVDLIAGDFDSSVAPVDSGAEIISLPDQNFTDFDKAVNLLISRSFEKIFVVGGSGKEDDHFLSNLYTLGKYADRAELILLDDERWIKCVSEKNFVFPVAEGSVVSLFGWPEAAFSGSRGLRFPLTGIKMDFSLWGSRNLAVENEANISLREGKYLIFVNDRYPGI
jgi:thiamine pyrophosphokinase